MLGLVIVAAVGSTIPILIITAGLIYATVVFRLARAIAMDVKVMDFVEVSKGRGENLWWIISKEIWPNVRMPLISDFGFIESGVKMNAPKNAEWWGAFGVLVTIIWIYIEMVRLLSKLRD